MPSPSIKICGISTAGALDAAIQGRADYAGFVFFPKSPRHVTIRNVVSLAARAQGRIGNVGLFVNPDDDLLRDAIAAGKLDIIQLHGSESPERAAQVRENFGLPVWKALPVASAGDIDRASAYHGAADLFLFDAKTPEGTLPGGMGLSFDWSLLASYRGQTPWGLAGGLNPDNVGDAIHRTGAPLVDTSSGVESAPGVKDVDRIAAFCKAARLI
ncbi:phosphoribosylanthranilate isomerase [Altericroceibacterium spongiae]|uniref:N-(5'-phosphoribosyl)anthranilate isomerase n=1 Tax=Altericroceibacterium spongiae TaxID=2320269 RepID=A0A420EEZ2_9SPHN|nr:phosphoribosylanthranilate isomerase [Altericroceibacterium spongiae]RKF19234.1 phosphoribosylanthranilate isomerase [Altericroceibacterium spongiae]